MNENGKNPTPGEPISEEQLDAVAGGAGDGSVSNPERHDHCWFRSAGEWREDGRTRCMSECKGIFSDGLPISWLESTHDDSWYICLCWGSDFCIDKWHKPCDRPPRTNW